MKVGLDLIEIGRIQRALVRYPSFRDRVFTEAERAYCESMARPAEHVAVRLAAKEAVYKALQGSEAARGIGWRDTEVVRSPDGRPEAILSGRAAARAAELGVRRVLLSLSHTHTTAIAVAVLETT